MTLEMAPEHVYLPEFIDDIARRDPSRCWVKVPRTTILQGDWREFSFAEFSKAINGAAKWIESTIGIARQRRETVAYLGIHDIRYAIIIFALMKTNRRALLLSLRNSDTAQEHLMKRVECTCYLHSEGLGSSLNVFRQQPQDYTGFQVPSIDELIMLGERHGHFTSYGGDGPQEIVLTMHSSGSTGMPKPINLTNIWMTTPLHHKRLTPPPNRTMRTDGWIGPSADGKTLITSAPWYHGMGLALILRSIFTGPLAILPPGVPVSGQSVTEALEARKATCGMFPPSIIEDVIQTNRGLEALSSLDDVFYGGAPLSPVAAERIQAVSRLSSGLGSLETYFLPAYASENPADWDYYEFHPAAGVVMEDAGDGLYELVIKRTGDLKNQPVFSVFPELLEERTKDLFEEHPKKPGLYRFRCRRDDLMVFSNGEKYDPITFEKMVENHPLVKGAVVVGHGQFQPGLLLEPEWSQVQGCEEKAVLDQVWPVIEAANVLSSAHVRMAKNMIILSKKEKPFPRTPKHTVAKRAVLDIYSLEIQALYSSKRVDEQLSAEIGSLEKGTDMSSIRQSIRRALKALVGNLPSDISDDDDIFKLGLDSLHILRLSKALQQAIGSDNAGRASLSPADVYINHTINKLAATIQSKLSLVHDPVVSGKFPREKVIAQLVDKYTSVLPSAGVVSPSPAAVQTVILTGSTGSLGNYILEHLLARPDVAKVYCLNRSDSAERRQKASFTSRGVSPSFGRVTFLQADYSRPQFGLPLETYTELSRTVTMFIHNAWAVNFNHALASFEPAHIAGVAAIAAFSLRSTHRCHIAFISSIAAVANSKNAVPIPERVFDEHSAPVRQGYGESKYVAERILAAAARLGASVSVLRCGQIAGPREGNGCWSKHEWLPSLVTSSMSMGVIPSSLGGRDEVDWVPVDTAARTVVECTFDAVARRGGNDGSCDVFHVANPRNGSWRTLVQVIRDFCKKLDGKEMQVVDFDAWMAALSEVPLTAEEARAKPSIKLVEFYDALRIGFPPVSTERTVACSRSLTESGPVDGELFQRWLRQWSIH